MRIKNRPFHERIGFALAGLRTGFARERSFRTQASFAVAALLVLLALQPAPVWWALVALVSALVLALELLNSAIECVIDLLHPGFHDEIKAAKDMIAGAVLMVSGAAVAIAIGLAVESVKS